MNNDNGHNTKVPAPAGPSTIGRKPEQPFQGKLGDNMQSMPGGSASKKGGPVKTVLSQPLTGKNGNGTSPMGSGGLINGKV